MRTMLWIFLFVFPLATFGQGAPALKARIIGVPAETLVGCPVHFTTELQNVSGHPIVLAIGPNGFYAKATFRPVNAEPQAAPGASAGQLASSGLARPPSTQTDDKAPLVSTYVATPRYTFRSFDDQATESRLDGFCCIDKPGEYIVQFVAHSDKPHFQKDQPNLPADPSLIWVGSVASEEVHLLVREPTGIDLKVYQASSGRPLEYPNLMGKYPESIYAACAFWEKAILKYNGTRTDVAWVVKTMDTGLYLLEEMSFPCKNRFGVVVQRRCDGEEAIACREQWIQVVLKHHPNIWFADDLRLQRAVDQIALKNYQIGQTELEAIARCGNSQAAEVAKQYLDIFSKKGWIKVGPPKDVSSSPSMERPRH